MTPGRLLAPFLLVLLLSALHAQGAPLVTGPAARVELVSEAGVWNGLSCVGAFGDRAGVPVWLPPGARVHAVTVSDGMSRTAAGWRAAGREALLVETPPGTTEACVGFDVDGARHALARFVAPMDLGAVHLAIAPAPGDVAQAEGVTFARGSLEGREADFASLGPMPGGEGVTLRVVDAGRVGELPLLVTVAGLALVVLVGALAWHAARPPLGGKPAERLLEHLGELQARLLPAAIAFALLNLVYFTMGLRTVHVGGVPLVAPIFGVEGSISARAFDAFAERLVPDGVTLVALRPVDAVLAQVQTALFLAFLTALPVLLYEIGAFLGPGLEPRERRILLRTLPLLTALFVLGALFGYLAMAPLMIKTLYGYAPGIGALPLLGVGDLVGFALLVMVAFGAAFELPVAMYALSRLGLVRAGTFGRYLRHAVLVIVILAGVLTPDPSVITQLLVAGPVTLLYLMGIGAAWFGGRRRGAGAA